MPLNSINTVDEIYLEKVTRSLKLKVYKSIKSDLNFASLKYKARIVCIQFRLGDHIFITPTSSLENNLIKIKLIYALSLNKKLTDWF